MNVQLVWLIALKTKFARTILEDPHVCVQVIDMVKIAPRVSNATT